MGIYNLMTIISFGFTTIPPTIFLMKHLWKWCKHLIAKAIMSLIGPELEKRINEIVEERLDEHDKQQENPEKGNRNAASASKFLRRLFHS